MTLIIDCHAHFEPRMLDAESVIAKMDALGVARVAMIPSMSDPFALDAVSRRLLAVGRRLLGRGTTRPLGRLMHRATYRKRVLHVGRLRVSIQDQPDNDSLAQLLARHPDRFLGWIFLNPRADPNVLETLERYRSTRGMIGIKLHPHWHEFTIDDAKPVLRRAEELGLPVLVHFGFGAGGDFRSLCRSFPKLRVIAAHAGFPFYTDLWKFADECPNLYVDLSSPYVDESIARRAVAAMGPRRCLYGTDSPYGFEAPDGSYDYGEISGWVERLPVSSAERDAIFGETFASMIGQSL